MAVERVERNSDGSYDAVDSGGFGKDYHGQDAFGERIGGTGIGGSHFGGFEEGHFGVGDGREHYEREATSYGDITQTESMSKSAFEADNGNESEEEAGSGMKDSLKDLNSESSEENNNVSSMDTSFQIDDTEEDKEKHQQELERAEEDKEEHQQELERAEENEAAKEKYQQELERAEEQLKEVNEWGDGLKSVINESSTSLGASIDKLESKSISDKIAVRLTGLGGSVINQLGDLAEVLGYKDLDRNKIEAAYKENGTDGLRAILKELRERGEAYVDEKVKGVQDRRDHLKSIVDSYKSPTTDKTKSSFTDKMKEAKPGKHMSNAKTSTSDYYTKANKDSTKELPKETPSRNDFGNHAVDTLKGVTDIVADNTTANALGIQSLEDFAKEKGVDPNKLSTMKAYRSYQNKQIMKAIPNLMKKIGGYITERIKDAFDPSQLTERIRNTLARYNAATLVGAAILSIQSGAGIQASIDQALTMVDPEDQPAVSDYLEDVLNDEGTVNDLKVAFDDALAPEQNSGTAELDESIVNIGRKDNTDYSDFNAGLGTTSDADVKVFIARNVKADPILRRMISKMGK
ncbi:MAG: hypothetical protein UHK60_06965 [Acutalibacteraceae bacterium]|nr:hypothetical protein [Acutalibacteraceae bacterium]